MKSIEDDEVEANNDKELDENKFELEIEKDHDQRKKESGSIEIDVAIECNIQLDYLLITSFYIDMVYYTVYYMQYIVPRENKNISFCAFLYHF